MKTQLEALEQLHFSWLVEREQTKVNLTLLKQKDPEQVVNSEQRNILGKTATINTTVAYDRNTRLPLKTRVISSRRYLAIV